MSDQRNGAHRALREQLGVHALGHGAPDERAAVQAHLDGCAACRAELAELLPVAARLSDVDPARLDDVPPTPPGLGDAVLARIAAERATQPVDLAARRRLRTRLAAASAAAGIAAAAFWGGWLARPQPPPIPLEAVAVQPVDAGITASAGIVPHTWGVEVKLSGEGFTAGEVYRVTVLDTAGTEVPAGEFLGVGPQELTCNLNSSVLREDAAGFEVLDASGAVVLTSTF